MRLLYGSDYARKYQAVADEIPAGSLVIDLCCGDCAIAPLLEEKGCKYIGLDINERFVQWAKKRGLDVRNWNAGQMDIPEGDVICMQSSLYQFMPNANLIIERMLKSARKAVIISEPIDNMTTSPSSLLRKLALQLTKVNGQIFPTRFTEATMKDLFKNYPARSIKTVPQGRECVWVISKEKHGA